MKFALIFENSGQHIILESLQDDVLQFVIDCFNSSEINRFEPLDDLAGNIAHNFQSLIDTVAKINEWPPEIRPDWIKPLDVSDCLDQQTLNSLHASWAQTMVQPWDISAKRRIYDTELVNHIFDQFPDDIMQPPTAAVLSKLNLLEQYRQINDDLHCAESSFSLMKFRTTRPDWIEFPNPFGTQIASNDHAHLALAFHHLGRTYYNKWLTFDHELTYDDENTFHQLLPFVDIKLTPARTMDYPKEYIEWCKMHDIEPSGDNVCLGNIPDLEQNLTHYRNIIFNNLAQGNCFTLQL